MDTITIANLRTQSSELIDTLKKGGSVSLIHRSKIVGTIKPAKRTKTFTKESIVKLKKLAEKLTLAELSYEEREDKYRKHLMEKYGKNIS